MAYNSGIPATGHSGSQDYTGIQGNFAQIQTSFSVNHEPLASGGGTEGFHTKVQIPAVITDPNLASPASSIYLKTFSGASELFFQNGSTAADVVQLTGNLVVGTDNLGNPDYTISTPFGLIFKFGGDNFAQGGTAMTFSTPFPNSFLGVVLGMRAAGGQGSAYRLPSVNGFTGASQSGTQFISWFAWGN